MPKFIQKYQCLFCGDLFNYELPTKEHEEQCNYNPSTKKCGTCLHLVHEYGNSICVLKTDNNLSTYLYYDENLECPYHTSLVLQEQTTKEDKC